MSRRLDRWRGLREQEAPELVVCRGGDCGSRRKHPRFDHVGQLARFREDLDGVATVTVSRCLDACERSDVVVVIPGRRARESGAQQIWVGEVLDDATTTAVIDWVATAGAATEPPEPLAAHRFVPGTSSRHDLAARRRRSRGR